MPKLISLFVTTFILCLPLTISANESTVDPYWYKNYRLKSHSIHASIFDGEMRYYTLNDHLINRPSIVMVHGVGGSSADFEPLVPLLGQHYRLIIIDLPGYGLSEQAKSDYKPSNYAASLTPIIRSIKNEKNIIIGHSMGGNVTIQMIAKSPDLAEQIILIDAAGMLHKYAYSKYVAMEKIDDIKYISQKNQNFFAGIIDKINQSLPDFTDMILSKKSREHLLKNNTTYISAISVMHEDLTETLRQLTTPALVIWGREDAVMPYQTAYMLQHFIAESKLNVLDNAGHSPQKDQPQVVYSAIRDYLTAQTNSSSPNQTSSIDLVNDSEYTHVDCRNKATTVNIPQTHFKKLTIANCPGIELHGVLTDELFIENSTIELFNVHITSQKTALVMNKSRLVVWGGVITGNTAFNLIQSKLDLNGVDLHVAKLAGSADRKSQVLASVSRLYKKKGQENWHGFIKKAD
ncbi:alpha/beta hydrolase fold protein [Catenovulum agarivorans DS-2]|uniref:Alpha/beta hydrolase fold protein n=1 Tax=Catenovulum agarivorans DS-2 TaxID=1328313 RepID=W7QRY5_9ALTE|nr:alpha/beta hydrolase [Catenovulum agarivorans]EWH10603.1 alpha/beta hydrolase fold protein [Catenovulum agarivorans DS-2]